MGAVDIELATAAVNLAAVADLVAALAVADLAVTMLAEVVH